MQLIIFGSTGATGRQIVAQALEQGHDVTAFARSPEKLDQKHEKLKVVQGDVLDLASVERAIQGQDVVLCTLGLPPSDKVICGQTERKTLFVLWKKLVSSDSSANHLLALATVVTRCRSL